MLFSFRKNVTLEVGENEIDAVLVIFADIPRKYRKLGFDAYDAFEETPDIWIDDTLVRKQQGNTAKQNWVSAVDEDIQNAARYYLEIYYDEFLDTLTDELNKM